MTRSDFADGHVFVGDTVGAVWGRALLALAERGSGGERSPLLFVIEGGADEDPAIRGALDGYLQTEGRTSVEDVAWTVFPESVWRVHGPKGRAAFFAAYRRALPWFAKANPANRRGLYFARMVGFDLDPATGEGTVGGLPDEGNQLETVIRLYARGRETGTSVHRIKLQVGIFDPTRDHVSGAFLTFPCLQHVTFEPDTRAGVLHTNAFYATQQLVRKAYGNLLGLRQLAAFMAAEMGLSPGRLSAFVGVEKLGDTTKTRLRPLVEAVGTALGGVTA